ncbi:hypothetical protein GW819_00350 [Candidatus Gracilibacteria bacterium]|nr:hypothetical protein [bacterium]NDK19275.1 hypothetical protein [Candidatus Gracilibacteria bacterium]OIO76596.1 MAG: hypothetical protein AUJ87_02460 [Candidatus Gracilibacteria bacterium CG1_02_38_174]PIQ10780.1 MAG: hypothetical protein COW68_03835 [Candidatus Gracilibacteria bacterium CG18_big_fil_WC_8_21_14_2_50_38_16]PIQ42052.1 MAG: hypothetical protein COW06_00910 [Candidatus Gracilibacteria bacterium CG12_big_fil_rev_8_21_14_0_65_38_15]PIZ01892.1 MAG: hypothetical protein COY60_0121
MLLKNKEDVRKEEEKNEKRRRVNLELRLIEQKQKDFDLAFGEERKADCFQILNIMDDALTRINNILR